MSRIRVLVADDHPVFRKGLQMLLPLVDKDLEVVGVASDGKEAIESLDRTGADVVLLDIKMPGMDGVEAARIISRTHPGTAVVILTTFDEKSLVYEALQAGAVGYLLKDVPAEQIVQAIRSAHGGSVLISPKAVASMVDVAEDAQVSAAERAFSSLTPRQQEVFYLILNGRDNARIAQELDISERTVRNYVSRIYEVIGIHNRAQAVVWAQAYGLV